MLLLCLCLSGCDQKNPALQQAMDFRSRLQSSGGCSFLSEVTSQIDGRAYQFTLRARCEADGSVSLTVEAPSTIQGIRAAISGMKTQIEFDALALDFGKLDDAMTTPLYAPYVFYHSWKSAYIDCAGEEEGLWHVSYRFGYEDQELTMECLLSDAGPQRCELYRQGKLLVSASVQEFTFLS